MLLLLLVLILVLVLVLVLVLAYPHLPWIRSPPNRVGGSKRARRVDRGSLVLEGRAWRLVKAEPFGRGLRVEVQDVALVARLVVGVGRNGEVDAAGGRAAGHDERRQGYRERLLRLQIGLRAAGGQAGRRLEVAQQLGDGAEGLALSLAGAGGEAAVAGREVDH